MGFSFVQMAPHKTPNIREGYNYECWIHESGV